MCDGCSNNMFIEHRSTRFIFRQLYNLCGEHRNYIILNKNCQRIIISSFQDGDFMYIKQVRMCDALSFFYSA